MVAVVVIVKMVMPSFAILRCGVEGPSEPNHRAEWEKGRIGQNKIDKSKFENKWDKQHTHLGTR